MLNLDPNQPFDARVAHHLEHDQIVWLTTVAPDGTPQPSPVWFLWDGETILIYSQPNAPKLRNIGRNPRVSLNFNGDRNGGDVVVITGVARRDPGAKPVDAVPDYVAKYAAALVGIGSTPEQMGAEFSAAIRIAPDHLRSH